MVSFDHTLLFILACYALATFGGIGGMLSRSLLVRRIACVLASMAFITQTVLLLMGSHTSLPGGLSWGAYLQLLAWFLVLCGIGGWWKLRTEEPLIFTCPLVLMLFIISWRYLHIQIRLPEALSGPFYALHIGTIFFSLGLMALAFGAGLLFLYVESRIKSKLPLYGFRKDFPALAILDKINSFTTFVGFPLFTIGMISGFIWAHFVWGSTVSGDPKEVISIFTWLFYAKLFHMRLAQGLWGRKPAFMAIAIFSLSIFSFFVVNSFFNTHHAFINRQ